MAGRITKAQAARNKAQAEYVARRESACTNLATWAGFGALAASAAKDVEKATAGFFLGLCQAWLSAPDNVLADPALIGADMNSDFFGAIKTAGAVAISDHQDRVALHKENPTETWPGGARIGELKYPMPKIGEQDARRNATRGIRARLAPLENLRELIDVDLQAARDCFSKDLDKPLTWTQIQNISSRPMAARCSEETNMVFTGIDADGCLHMLGHDYKKAYEVSQRELADGTTEEFCAVTVGPNGATEELEVVIGKAASGPLYAEARQDAIKARNTARSRNKFLKACEEAARLPQYMMVDPSAKSNG